MTKSALNAHPGAIDRLLQTMRTSSDRTQERYTSGTFQRAQDLTEPQRRKLLPVLGLRDEQLKWFEMPIKENLEQFAHLEEVQAVQNLLIVHYIEIPGEVPPPEVLASVRGTIIYQLQGKYFVIRKSIPYTYDVVMDSIVEQDGKCVFSVPQGRGTRDIKVAPSALKIVPYIEGTVIDIMKIDGVVQWFTSHNVLPKGVRREGRAVYKKSRFGHHEAFTDDFENIISACDPGLLNENNELFPKKCKTSNKLYRFILLTRGRVRAETIPVSRRGILVYLGCITQFQYTDYPELDFGEEHTEIYPVRCEPYIPLEDRPSIVQYNPMTIAEANKHLAGPHPELGLLSGGGKLVVTARVKGAGDIEIVNFHIKSTSYQYREDILGHSPDMYKEFAALLNLSKYDFANPQSVREYYRRFPSVVLPSSAEEVSMLRSNVLNKYNTPVILSKEMGVPTSPLTHIWFIFLACVNVSAREIPMRFLERYSKDVAHLILWMFPLKAREPFVAKSNNPKHLRKAEHDKDVVLRFRTEILRHELYKKDEQAVRTIMLLLGDKTAECINISRRVTGTKMESIAISEPEMRVEKPRSYATVVEGARD